MSFRQVFVLTLLLAFFGFSNTACQSTVAKGTDTSITPEEQTGSQTADPVFVFKTIQSDRSTYLVGEKVFITLSTEGYDGKEVLIQILTVAPPNQEIAHFQPTVADAKAQVEWIAQQGTFFVQAQTLDRVQAVQSAPFDVQVDQGDIENPYFIDFETGNDDNPGTRDLPWKHCPGDLNATGQPRAHTIYPGDAFYFKGGVIYNGSIEVKASGKLGEPVTFRGNDKTLTWGIGKAKINLAHTYYHAFVGNRQNYIKIFNFDIAKAKNTLQGTYLISRNGHEQSVTYPGSNKSADLGFIRINDSEHWAIQDCSIHEAESYTDLCVERAQARGEYINPPGNQVGIFVDTSQYIDIINNEIWGIGRDLTRIVNSHFVTVENCDLGGVQGQGYFSVASRISQKSTHITLRGNKIHDGWQYEGDDPDVRCHAGDAIHLYGNPDSVLLESNFFFNNKAFGYRHGSAFSMMEQDATNVTWRNNIIANPHANFIFKIRDVNRIYIYNNLFVIFPFTIDGQSAAINLGPTAIGYPGDDICIKNNIFYQKNGFHVLKIWSENWKGVVDNNLYFSSQGNEHFVRVDTTTYTLRDWQNLFGQDLSSHEGNPQLTDIPSTGATSSQGNYHPTSLSDLVIDRGFDLSATGFSDDFDKVTRPSGAWDRGPFEYR